MKKIILVATILLYNIGVSQIPKEGLVSFSASYDHNIYKETGKIKFNKGMKDVYVNKEVIATIEGDAVFAYSLKNGQLTLAVNKTNKDKGQQYIIMYTIDMENNVVKKKDRLNMKYAYKDSNLELSIIGDFYDRNADTDDLYDTNAVIMQYTWKGKTDRIILPAEMKLAFSEENYISKSGHIVSNVSYGNVYVFSMDKKKFTNIGRFRQILRSSLDIYIPLNEYVIFSSPENFTANKVYLYRYVEEELYTTRYQKINHKTQDSIISNIKNRNIYEQFLPLTRVENIDSIVNINSAKASNQK